MRDPGGRPVGKTPRHRKKADSKSSSTKRSGRKKKRTPTYQPDPSDTDSAEVRFVQPFDATKTYLCPGCNREIPPGTGHLVVVPVESPDLRRHWHRGCWVNRSNRR